ncbi:OmpA family protein [Salegentibacter salegens]|uniref:OmpA family protein n=1 Tax=Salegentibacter salegens TaxID=143223 RepID=A0A1M7NGM5_9FLAO|nr:OmpA family protein [Salegentibacter salegens]PRX46243.1 OmpA family protein [Salegentibacter salegens]SHN02950.1 OmpA family protein [Salegentibacter salegens]
MGQYLIRSIVFLSLLCAGYNCVGQINEQVIAPGAYVINMGSNPQTAENSLQAYGLIYNLLKDEKIEVKWVISPEKEKDGTDFTYKETAFKGSAFIIPVSYITGDIKKIITSWEEKGVVGLYLEASIRVPVFSSLSVAPRWTLDRENGYIALPFFKAAAIPEEAYGGNSSKNWKSPENLGVCDDIFVMPHADPGFTTHKNLYTWNSKYKGAIWAGCHAVSKLENLSGNIKFQDKDSTEFIQLNFLSSGFPGAQSAGLIHYKNHRHGTPPYQNLLPADPVAQYMGRPDKAHLNGSERIFLPKKINRWRKETRKIVIDEDAPDIPEIAEDTAVVTAYGHAYGNPENGLVMYQAGHSIYGKEPSNIAALRAFFNWSFYATEIKRRKNALEFGNLNGQPVLDAKVGDDLTGILRLKPIHFDLDKSEIRPGDKPALDSIVTFMKIHPALLLDIRSHTDSRANDAYNMQLSERRVEATIKYLIAKGISEARITGRGYGETELLNNCGNNYKCTEAGHEENRRSEFILAIDCDIYSKNEF